MPGWEAETTVNSAIESNAPSQAAEAYKGLLGSASAKLMQQGAMKEGHHDQDMSLETAGTDVSTTINWLDRNFKVHKCKK